MTEDRKRIIVYDTDERHVQFKLCLRKFGLTQTKVFRQIITSFLSNDELSQAIVRMLDDSSKKKSHKRTKLSQKKDESSLETRKKMENKLNLDNEELEDIFDMIAREHPDL